MRFVPRKKGKECATMKTDVKFEDSSDFSVKFHPRIEKNYEKILEATQDEVCAPQKGSKMCQNEN